MKHLAFALAWLIAPLASASDWQWVAQQKGVTVYTRPNANNPYHSFKAETVTDASIDQLLPILRNVSDYKEWFAYTHSTQLISHGNEKTVFYLQTNFPWPYKNEDMVYELSLYTKTKNETQLKLVGLPQHPYEQPNADRMRSAFGVIHLIEEQNQTRIQFEMTMHLGGNILPTLANKFIHKLPIKSLAVLVDLAESDYEPSSKR